MPRFQISIRWLLSAVAIFAFIVAVAVAFWPKDPFSGRDFDAAIWRQFADNYE